MGRRPGSTTKSGRFMNPADQERKSMRQKELKRNRKQRTMVRHAILKSKDIDEILENLSRLDDQEFDLSVEYHSKYVFNEKRVKFKQTYNEVINLYKQEKRDDKVKELQQKMVQYEADRSRKMQQYNALRFSLETNPTEIPLPDGSSFPNAAMTPSVPAIPAQYLITQVKTGILKNPQSSVRDNERAFPPGPPCGLPPSLGDEDDLFSPIKRRVRFEDDESKFALDDLRDIDEDYGPVDIPVEVLLQNDYESAIKDKAIINLAPPIPQPPLIHAPPMPPNILPPVSRIPIHMPPPPPNFQRPGLSMPFIPSSSSGDSIIAAEPIVRPTHDSDGINENGINATIMAEPKLRDLTKEVTKLVPTTLCVNRNKTKPKRIYRNKFNMMGVQIESAQRKEAKDTDEAYAEFMKEMSSLI